MSHSPSSYQVGMVEHVYLWYHHPFHMALIDIAEQHVASNMMDDQREYRIFFDLAQLENNFVDE